MTDGYDIQFASLNVGAHRRPAPRVGTPSLIWHQGYWKPEDMSRERWHEEIDVSLAHLFKVARELHAGDIPPKTLNLQSNGWLYLLKHKCNILQDEIQLISIEADRQFVRYDSFSLQIASSEGCEISIRASLYRELWTLTFIVDFAAAVPVSDQCASRSRSIDETGVASERRILNDNFLREAAAVFQDASAFASKRFRDHEGATHPRSNTVEDKELFTRARTALIDKFRACIEKVFLGPSKERHKTRNGTGAGLAFANRFADFMGSTFGVFEDSTDESAPALTMVCPGHYAGRWTIHAQVSGAPYTDPFAVRAVDAMWPITKALHEGFSNQKENIPSRLDARTDKSEFTVSKFQGGRAIYISSLGRLNPDVRGNSYEPVVFSFLIGYRNRYQLGRLIDRILSLGTLRLAALRDIEQLTEASERLVLLESPRDAAVMSPMAQADELNRIAGEIKPEGLQFRIDRSRYYVKEFETQLEQLRCGRVEGFQPYDMFVKRRLYGTFDFLHRIGTRFNRAGSEVDLRLQRDQINQLLELQNITKSQTEELVRIQKSASAISSSIARTMQATGDILKYSEWIIAAPITYYFGHVVYDVGKEFSGWLRGKGLEVPEQFRFGHSLSYLIGLLLAYLFVRYLRRRYGTGHSLTPSAER